MRSTKSMCFSSSTREKRKEDLVRLRKEICERHIKSKTYRMVEAADPPRDRTPSSYEPVVRAWHEQRAGIYERLIGEELGEDECGAFLVWGDPSLYDSTLRIIDQIVAKGTVAFDYEVIPGITAVQALAAQTQESRSIGSADPFTSPRARKISEGLPNDTDDVIVMLDANCSFKTIDDPGMDIYWGAYIGTKDEILIAGNLRDRAHDIERMPPWPWRVRDGSWTLSAETALRRAAAEGGAATITTWPTRQARKVRGSPR